MSFRIAKINKHVQRMFGEVLQGEADIPDDVLVTISQVQTSANLQRATVWLYISPLERAKEVLAQLTQQLYYLQGALNRKLTLRPFPRLELGVDHGARDAERIGQVLLQLTNEP